MSREAERFAADCARIGLGKGERIGLAVSGGPDSLALLLLAAEAFPGRCLAATVDHGLRREAAAEAAMVAAVCRSRGVPHATLAVTLDRRGEGIQAAARRARYAALEGWASEQGAGVVMTAHHADDQAETILMRLARGAGIGGLAGIRPNRPLGPVRLLRPLLGWRKAALIDIVEAAGLEPAADPSNRDPRHDRTRVRQLLAEAPLLDARRIASVAPALADAEAAIAWGLDQAAARIVRKDGAVSIDPGGLPREIRRRLLLRIVGELAPTARPHGPELLRLLTALQGGQVATLAGLRFEPGPPWRISHAPPHRRHDRSV